VVGDVTAAQDDTTAEIDVAGRAGEVEHDHRVPGHIVIDRHDVPIDCAVGSDSEDLVSHPTDGVGRAAAHVDSLAGIVEADGGPRQPAERGVETVDRVEGCRYPRVTVRDGSGANVR